MVSTAFHVIVKYKFGSSWLLFGRDILRQTSSAMKDKTQDIHTRLMERYKPVPHWWFFALLIVALVLSTVGAEVFKDQLQLPWWGVLMGFAIATFFALPFGVLVATANQVTQSECYSFLMRYKYQSPT